MKQWLIPLTVSVTLAMSSPAILAATETTPAPYTSTQKQLVNMTPSQALQRLKNGNIRFVNNKPISRNLLQQAKATNLNGQFPSAVILSCMDSRGPAELIFDQGLGDIFSIRVAGNIIDTDQLGSMEFATKAVGTKLVVVMGHTNCGAIRGACRGTELGNLTELLDKIKPAVQDIKEAAKGNVDCSDDHTIDKIAKQNVLIMIKQVQEKSPIISDLVTNKKVMIVGAMHDLHSGKVHFFDANGHDI